MSSTAPFDPFTQTFTLLLADSTPFNLTIPDLDDFILYNVQICINYGSQLGASLVLLIVLLLLTKPDKRLSPISILNTLGLTINVIRNIIQCLYFTGPFSETYAYFGQDYSRVPKSDYATSIAGAVLTFILLICVEMSLIFQVRVMCVMVRESYRLALFVVSNMIALPALGFRFALCVENAQYIISLTPPTALNWLESASNITTSISICWFCIIFVTKLGFALVERKKLGIGQFGPMQIIFIMGCQTLVIPAIFSIIQYFSTIPEISSNVLTLVIIFLPLSSLWASASNATRTRSAAQPAVPNHRSKKVLGSFNFNGSAGPSVNDKILDGQLSPTFTTTTAVRSSQSTGTSHNQDCKQLDLYDDLEKQ